MSRSSDACAKKAKSTLYVVTLPDGRVVISSQPLLHNNAGKPVNNLTTKPVKELDGSVVLFLVYLELLNVMPDRCVSKTKIPVLSIWNNICVFLTGKPFYLHGASEFPGRQLARLSIAVSCPYLSFGTDQVVRAALVHAALCGDEDLAKKMIAVNPRYLLWPENATDFSGRTFKNITPFQAALITGDDKMAEMIKPYFDRLPDGQAEMQKQVTEIFPDGIGAHEAAQKQKSETDFEPMLEEVIAAIKTASFGDLQSAFNNGCNGSRLYLVLNKFRAAFDSLSHNEKIFNPNHLLKAFEAYADKCDLNNPDCETKLDLFWRQVIGFVQRFLPANYAQVFAYSLYSIVENKHTCPRSFNFRSDPGFSFYPSVGSFTGLGFNYAGSVAIHDGGTCCGAPEGAMFVGQWSPCVGASVGARIGADSVSKLISSKNTKLSELITQRVQSTHSCIIHVT